MDQYELELKRALERCEPGSDFTARVMSQIRSERSLAADVTSKKIASFPRMRSGVWRWAAVGAVAASLTLGFVVEQRRSERLARIAEAELYETLLLAGEKISQARAEVIGVRYEGGAQ
jgi:hypothetical protein